MLHDLENNGIFGAFCERHPTGAQWGQGSGCPIVDWLLLLLVRSLAGMTELFNFIDEVKGCRNYLLVLSIW